MTVTVVTTVAAMMLIGGKSRAGNHRKEQYSKEFLHAKNLA
jgi:hypothetical protein